MSVRLSDGAFDSRRRSELVLTGFLCKETNKSVHAMIKTVLEANVSDGLNTCPPSASDEAGMRQSSDVIGCLQSPEKLSYEAVRQRFIKEAATPVGPLHRVHVSDRLDTDERSKAD